MHLPFLRAAFTSWERLALMLQNQGPHVSVSKDFLEPDTHDQVARTTRPTGILPVLFTCLSVLSASCGEEPKVMKLPGQRTGASESLVKTLREVEERIGRPIEILDITTHPNPVNRLGRGRHDWTAESERLWLNPSLAYDDQEAVAAHELAHVLQKAEGYCQTATNRGEDGRPVFPQLTLLGRVINSTVMDAMADRWAAKRGFKVEESLKFDALPKALADMRKKRPDEAEAVAWHTYYADLERLANIVESGRQIQGPALLPPEIKTQILAVGYAGLKLRFSPFGLFSELDALWLENRPEARNLGTDIASLVETTGYESKEQCEASVIAVIEYLKIPPSLIVVKRPLTGEIVWPR